MSPKKFLLLKQNFEWHDIPNLLNNIWDITIHQIMIIFVQFVSHTNNGAL